jgi:hypothetical protein
LRSYFGPGQTGPDTKSKQIDDFNKSHEKNKNTQNEQNCTCLRCAFLGSSMVSLMYIIGGTHLKAQHLVFFSLFAGLVGVLGYVNICHMSKANIHPTSHVFFPVNANEGKQLKSSLACFSEPFGIHFCLVEDTFPPDPWQNVHMSEKLKTVFFLVLYVCTRKEWTRAKPPLAYRCSNLDPAAISTPNSSANLCGYQFILCPSLWQARTTQSQIA